MPNAVPDFVRQDLARLEIALDEPVLQRLARYLDLLLETNQRINLTGIRERDEAWRRHIVDSLTLLPGLEMLDAGAAVIDVGSGGGLPGVPVALALPHLRMTLLEVTGKKASFLREVVQALDMKNTQVLQRRAEQAGQDSAHRERYEVSLCRALGPLRELLEYTLPLVQVGGRLLAMKGPKAEAELAEAGDALTQLGAGDLQVIEAYPESFGLDTVIVSIVKEQPTPKRFPRSPGTPRQSPL